VKPRTKGRWARLAVLATGDLVISLLFPLLGSASHDQGLTAGSILRSTLSFTATWVMEAPFLRAYAPAAISTTRGAVLRALNTWAAAGPLALVGWAVLLDRHLDFAFIGMGWAAKRCKTATGTPQ